MAEDTPVADALIRAMPAWQLAVFRFNDAVAESLGIAPSDLQCLFVFDRRGRTIPSELAQAVDLSTGAMSRIIERLVQAGMMTREHDTGDRRRVHVDITPGARTRLHALYDPLDERLRGLLDAMGRRRRTASCASSRMRRSSPASCATR